MEFKGLDMKSLLTILSVTIALGSIAMWIFSFGEFKNTSEMEWAARAKNTENVEELTKIQVRLVTLLEVQQRQIEMIQNQIDENRNN